MPESASEAVRAADGATPEQQLDHRMALAVGGSNDNANLKAIPTSENQAASSEEGDLAGKIASGDISLFEAQNEEAQAKGLPTPWTDQEVRAFTGTSNVPNTGSGGVSYFSYRGPSGPTTTAPLDPSAAKPLSLSSFFSASGVAARANLKTQMGAAYSDALDRSVALALTGATTPSDPLSSLAQQVIGGKISLAKAQESVAGGAPASAISAKIPQPAANPQSIDFNALTLNGQSGAPAGTKVQQYEEELQTDLQKSATANSAGGITKAAAGQIANWAYTLGSSVLDHLRASISSPQAALSTGQGVVQTAVVKPFAFMQGIGNSILRGENAGLDKVFGTHISEDPNAQPTNTFATITSMNDSIDRSPDEQKAYDTGNFLGWLVPYDEIGNGIQAIADLSKVGEIVPKIASLIPYVSDAAAFLGTGQVLHTPDQGSRLQQLKNDSIALALFEVGGFALGTVGSMIARGARSALSSVEAPLADVLDPEVKAAASEQLKPVVEQIKSGQQVPIETIDHAITAANAIIEDATGKDPQTLLQEHLGLNESPKIPISPESVPAHNTLENAIPMYHEQNVGRFQRGLDAISAARTQLIALQKQMKSFPEASLQSDAQKAIADKAASLQDYISKNKTFESYWSGTRAGDSEPRAQAILHNMNDSQIANYTDQYKADVKQHTALGYDMPSEITDQFPETKVEPAAVSTPATAEEAAGKYWDASIAPALESGKTVEVSGDAMKEYFGKDYAPAKSDMYSQASYQTMQKLLDNPDVKDVTFLGGGSGAGKSEILGDAIKADNATNVLYDNSFSNEIGARTLIEQVLASGKDLHIAAILPDLDRAKAFTESRAAETGRTVSPEAFVRSHMGFVDTMKALLSDGTIKPDQVSLYDLRGKTLDQAKQLVANGDTVKDPLALLNDVGYSKEELNAKYGPETTQEADTQLPENAQDGKGGGGLLQKVGPEEAKQIKLPDLPQKSAPLLGVAFPGADIITTFIQKDIIGKFADVKEAVTGIYKATHDLFNPSAETEAASAIAGSAVTKMEQFASAAWSVAEDRRDWWAKVPETERLDFIDKMETGDATYDMFSGSMGVQQTLAELANDYRTRLNKAFDFEADAGIKTNYVTDYWPHMWTDPEEAAVVFQNFADSFPKGYSEAFGSFQDVRTIDLIKQGLDNGLKLVTSNPEEMVLMREVDGFRVATRAGMMDELANEGLAHQQGDTMYGTHANWPLVRGADGKMWAVTPDAAKVLDNAFFQPSLWSKPGVLGAVFRTFMTVKGMVVPFQLSLSGFHPFHVQTISSATAMTQAFMRVLDGTDSASNMVLEFGKDLSTANTIGDLKDYLNVVKMFNTPLGQLSDTDKQTVQYMIDGGFAPTMSEEFKIRAADGFKQAVQESNYLGAAIRGIPKLVQMLQTPIFEYYVPALKAGAYMQGVADALAKTPELATDDTARKVTFRAIANEMDYRFGEMHYSTKFWNPMMTEIGQASFLSLGWQLGFINQFGGGALDLATLAKNLVTGKASVEDITPRMVFATVYTLQSAMWGGLMNYAMTGKLPSSAQDLFFPQTGQVNADGSPARLNTPFYTREWFSLVNHVQKQGWVGGPVSMIQNKANPILTTLADIWSNKDFYGYEIHDQNATAATQAAQVFGYILSNNFSPISIKGAIAAAPTTGTPGIIASIAGFNPAPAYIAETDMQTKIFATLDERTGGAKPLASQAAANAKTNIKKLYQSGNTSSANSALTVAIAAGYIKQTGLTTFMKDADLPGDVLAFKDLAQFPSDQQALLAQMNESDLQRYAQYAAASIKQNLSALSPAAAQFVRDINSGKIKVDTFKAGKVVGS